MRLLLLFLATFLTAALSIVGPSDGPVDFRRDVEPILRERCSSCHGPERQRGGLRLDSSASARFGGDSGRPALVAGDIESSELLRRIVTEDEGERMPADEPPLPADEIDTLRRWVESGADWPDKESNGQGLDHWAYVPPASPHPPPVQDEAWCRTPLDRFVLARLEEQGIAPSPEADRATLMRRASLDLLGLPPTPEELDAFLADTRPDAWERQLERLLASPHFGERMARHWLDMARYADSNGYTFDTPRNIWPYRDWVVDAFNADMPFDRFTLDQLAGDLLPEPTRAQLVATGFQRNTQVNEEAGVDELEFRVEAIKDRVDTTATVWLGSTLACAQCHTHKYDPFTQKDYYRFFAFFNNTEDRGARRPARDDSGLDPLLELPTPDEEELLNEVDGEIAALERALLEPPDSTPGLEQWEEQVRQSFLEWTPFVISVASSQSESTSLGPDDRGAVLVRGRRPMEDTYTLVGRSDLQRITALRLDVLSNPKHPKGGPGRSGDGNFVLTRVRLGRVDETPEGPSQPALIPLVSALSSHDQPVIPSKRIAFRERPFPISATLDGDTRSGWAVGPRLGEPQSAVFLPGDAIVLEEGTSLQVTLEQAFGFRSTFGRFRLLVTSDPISPGIPLLPPDVEAILRRPFADRSDAEKKRIWRFYASNSEEMARKRGRLKELKRRRPKTATTLVMRERGEVRKTHLLVRGSYLDPGQEVEPGVPEFLPQIKAAGRASRVDLARWLVAPENPLTHRVVTNRLWQRLFGLGLVETENDFGTRGERPSHPELLDWLALEFRDNGMRFKPLLRLLLNSATYRQSSRNRPELATLDPRNRWLARQNRLRNDAETIRDAALVASGLLQRELGGPPVFPPQPPGVFDFTQATKPWQPSTGPDRFRRTLYTWIWRTSPFPYLTTFDAPQATMACTRRNLSNTPLQALTQANDPMIVEIARGLAARALALDASTDERLTQAFRWSTSRIPGADEVALLRGYLQEEQTAFADDPAARSAALLDLQAPGADPAHAAAWVSVARVLLNTDEFLTRE